MSNQRTTDDKAAYHTPELTVFGALTAVTLSGSGTVPELLMMDGTMCIGGTATMQMMKYPCG